MPRYITISTLDGDALVLVSTITAVLECAKGGDRHRQGIKCKIWGATADSWINCTENYELITKRIQL